MMKRHLCSFRHGSFLLLLVLAIVPASALAVPGSMPLGTYTATVEGNLWQMTFTADGQYDVLLNGQLEVEGHFTATPQTLIIHDDSGPSRCTPQPVTGVYSWDFEDNQLILTVLADQCDGREGILTAGPWNLQ